MKRKIMLIGCCLLAVLPSALKIWLLRLQGAKIGKGCYIGLSIVHAKKIEMSDHAMIGHFNLLNGVDSLEMATGSKVESFNWITGAGKGSFFLGRNASVRRFHFFEASGDVRLGANSIVAGRSSLFFTHGIKPTDMHDTRSIEIGDWCYIGAGVRFLPGARVAKGCFVGMGAVVTGAHREEFSLIAGSPAKPRASFTGKEIYFQQTGLRHRHHPADYTP